MKKTFKRLWKEESAQGATEYILMLVIVVGIAVIFKDKIKGLIEGKMGQLEGKINSFE